MKYMFLLALTIFTVLSTADILFKENFDMLSKFLKPAKDENIPSRILGWTHTPPANWHIDNSKMKSNGTKEWQGWSFATKRFWVSAESQGRENFALAKGIFAIVDPDEWDDFHGPHPPKSFNSVLITPKIKVKAGVKTYLTLDSHFQAYGKMTAKILISFNGDKEREILRYDSNFTSDNAGGDRQNEAISIPISAPKIDSTLTIKFSLTSAANDWFWAIDNIVLSDTIPKNFTVSSPNAKKHWKAGSIVNKCPLIYFRTF